MASAERPAAEETQSFTRFLVLALIGVATALLTELGEQDLPPTQRVLVILATNLIVPAIEHIFNRMRRRPAPEEHAAPVASQDTAIAQTATKPLNIGLILALVLLLLAALFLNFSLGVLLLITWTVLLLILVNAGSRLPLGSTGRTLLTGVAAVSVGSALAFGGRTVAERGPILADPDEWPTVAIETNCPLTEPQEGQPDLSQPQKVPPVVVTVRTRDGQLSVDQVMAPLLEPYLGEGDLPQQVDLPPRVQAITIDGQPLPPEGTLEVDLGARRSHQLTILCN